MKTLLYIFALVICSNTLFGQDLENKLNEIYPADKVLAILNNPQKKDYYNKLINSSFKIEKYPASKLQVNTFEVLNELEIRDKNKNVTILKAKELIEQIENGSFNILLSSIERKFNDRLTFRLGTTNTILTIYSYKELTK